MNFSYGLKAAPTGLLRSTGVRRSLNSRHELIQPAQWRLVLNNSPEQVQQDDGFVTKPQQVVRGVPGHRESPRQDLHDLPDELVSSRTGEPRIIRGSVRVHF